MSQGLPALYALQGRAPTIKTWERVVLTVLQPQSLVSLLITAQMLSVRQMQANFAVVNAQNRDAMIQGIRSAIEPVIGQQAEETLRREMVAAMREAIVPSKQAASKSCKRTAE